MSTLRVSAGDQRDGVKVVVVTGYTPISNHPRGKEDYRRLGEGWQEISSAPVRMFSCSVEECWLDAHVRGREVAHAVGDNPKKNSLAYHVVIHQKTAWLVQALEADPEADVFVWIDYGIFHVRGVTPAVIDAFLGRVRSRSDIAIPGAWERSNEGISSPDWHFLGGLIVVPADLVRSFHAEVQEAALSLLEKKNFVTWEVNSWSAAERHGAVPICWYKADHDQTMFTDFPGSTATPTIYVVSLASVKERRSRMRERLGRQCLEYEIVEAFDRDDEAVQKFRDPAKDTQQGRGVAACLGSHLKALRDFVASGADEAIIVEDDVLLAKDFQARFERLRANIPDACSLVCLGYLVWDWAGFSWAGLNPAIENLKTMGQDVWGTQMYWLRRSWAEECLERLDRDFAAIETLQRYINSETVTRDAMTRGGLVAHPPLALEDLTGSLLVPEAGNANHLEPLSKWDLSTFDCDKNDIERMTSLLPKKPGARPLRYVHDPGQGSRRISGFPAVIVGHVVDAATGIVPGRHERDLVDWARELVSAEEQFVDIGAHMGSWTLIMADHAREVHAFEPQRLIYQQLCGNVALNGLSNVYAYNVGLDDRPGQLTLQRPGIDRGSSSARSDVADRFKAEGVPLSPERIEVVTLDSFATDLVNVGLVKIDVEGLELRVLKGAVEVLRQNALPKILVECWSADWYAQDKKDLLAFLEDLGYRIVPITGYADVLLAGKR